VIDPATGAKLAGAALKRHRTGLLAQGSLAFPGRHALDRLAFARNMGERLAEWLGLRLSVDAGPLAPDWLERERQRFASAHWNRLR